jgi:hypothetical protein
MARLRYGCGCATPPLGVDDDRWNAEGALIGDAGACNGEFIGELPATAPEMWLSASDAGPSLILRASDFEIVKNLKATTTICRRRVVFDPFPSPTMPRRRTPLAAGWRGSRSCAAAGRSYISGKRAPIFYFAMTVAPLSGAAYMYRNASSS